jgi:hypothetical protein
MARRTLLLADSRPKPPFKKLNYENDDNDVLIQNP